MSDYSNLKIERVDDIPEYISYGSDNLVQSKAFAPAKIRKTLPVLDDMQVGDTIKLEVPEDRFGYKSDRYKNESKGSMGYYSTLTSALRRTFGVIASKEKIYFVYRVDPKTNELYIKRVDG